MAGNLVNLKELWIEDCEEMVEVIKDDEEKGMSGGRQRAHLLFPKLHRIYLSKLSKLVSFCELKCDVEFPSLRKVTTYNCPNMKNFTLGSLAAPNLESFATDLNNYRLQVPFISPKQLSVFGNEKPLNCYQIHGSVFDRLEVLNIDGYKGSMSLFSSSITGNLVNLTTLTIRDCFKMVKVIEEKEEEKEKVVSGAQRTIILFPKLHKIELWNLPSLVRFCEWKCDVELPSLTEVVIDDCDNMKSFTLGPLNTPKLESVKIHGKHVGGVKDLNGLVQQQYINRTENLRELTLVDLPVLKQLWMSSQNELGKDFLPQLEVLDIRRCGMMETVFLWKGEDGNENNSCHHITKSFPKLKELQLFNLPNLISLCQGIEGIEFPLLRRMEIKGCKKMKGMTANGVTNNENNSGGTHHIFCESRVSFGCLKQLTTDRNPFCCHTIRVSLLNGLEELEISNCAGSRSLFTSSMAGNLLNLKELRISECEDMVEVIKDDEEKGMSGGQRTLLYPKMVKVIEEKEEEKEKVVSGAQRTTILFPKLHKIQLSVLPKLVRFCEWKCDVELPSLTEVVIIDCHNMKSFTLGPLNTPKLESVKINWKEFGGVKDLNGLVQQQYINRIEKKQAEEAEKKKGGEEEQERKGEIEEEQN